MNFFSQLSAHFWLFFALAVSIAVFRELKRDREASGLPPGRRKPEP